MRAVVVLLTACLAASIPVPLRAQPASAPSEAPDVEGASTRTVPPIAAPTGAPLDIAPRPVPLAVPSARRPRAPERIAVRLVEPRLAGTGWPTNGPVNSRAADVLLAAPVEPEPRQTERAAVAPSAPAPTLEPPKALCSALASIVEAAARRQEEARLAALEASLVQRTREIEARSAELRALIEEKRAIERRASDQLAAIIAKMRPEAAAAQLAAAEEAVAAALLGKLGPRGAGAILNEMEAGKAARLQASLAELRPQRASAPVAAQAPDAGAQP